MDRGDARRDRESENEGASAHFVAFRSCEWTFLSSSPKTTVLSTHASSLASQRRPSLLSYLPSTHHFLAPSASLCPTHGRSPRVSHPRARWSERDRTASASTVYRQHKGERQSSSPLFTLPSRESHAEITLSKQDAWRLGCLRRLRRLRRRFLTWSLRSDVVCASVLPGRRGIAVPDAENPRASAQTGVRSGG